MTIMFDDAEGPLLRAALETARDRFRHYHDMFRRIGAGDADIDDWYCQVERVNALLRRIPPPAAPAVTVKRVDAVQAVGDHGLDRLSVN